MFVIAYQTSIDAVRLGKVCGERLMLNEVQIYNGNAIWNMNVLLQESKTLKLEGSKTPRL